MSHPGVLVVEDQILIRLNALDFVSAAGFEGIDATNADDAVRILKARADISIVFTDIEMPGSMDGLKLAHYISERYPKVRVIVTSGKAIIKDIQLPVGHKFYSKPYDEEEIVGEMKRMISGIGSGSREIRL